MSIQLIREYQTKVEKLIQYSGSRNESALRKAFQDLLESYAQSKHLLLIPELPISGKRITPDGTLKDALRQDWGYWESKDEKDNLEDEIATKLAKGYPTSNMLFEDKRTAVLYQVGAEVERTSFDDADELDHILTRFVSYEPPKVSEFRRSIEQFHADVPALAEELRAIITEQLAANESFRQAMDTFLELCRISINPNIQPADLREMVIQHLLTEDVFMTVFDEAQFHSENVISRKMQEVVGTFYTGTTRHRIRDRIAPYYETVNARAAEIASHFEKQRFLKVLYESFYRAYNPKAADRLGVIYTPEEIVRFMIHGADYLVSKHFDRTLGDRDVEILDPATGTGTFMTELIEHLPAQQLRYKYSNELHCNEVAILPYYIANLNIEYTYKQKTGEYLPFDNICFVDTLDNLGFKRSGTHQPRLEEPWDENIDRIKKQNDRRIAVIIGNPPYNANQLNENENNKNREYPAVDRRIKETYVHNSTAQKTKLYDMYARFFRWASDRVDQNGIVAFVSNNSYLDARGFDGFRKVVADEFSHIYVLDLGGNVRQNPKLSGTTHNVFGIQVGVAIIFMVKTKPRAQRCRIWYTRRPELERAKDKLEYLRTTRFEQVEFEAIHPDKQHNWLNLEESDWDSLIPLVAVSARGKRDMNATRGVFGAFSTGISTNRDEWIVDIDPARLKSKMRHFVEVYSSALKSGDSTFEPSIKWSRNLKQRFSRGQQESFRANRIVRLAYRPFSRHYFYDSEVFVDEDGLLDDVFAPEGNVAICVSGRASSKPFQVLVSDKYYSLDMLEKTQGFPLRLATADGMRENITRWALAHFQAKYGRDIGRGEIFNYVYGVLHDPAYRAKYQAKLRQDLPRIPLYGNFPRWAEWGHKLMDLHLGYETVEAYPLIREDRPASANLAPQARLIARKEASLIEVDSVTTLRGVPPEAWKYRLGNRSALEWVLDRYKERPPKDPTIRERFNTYRFADHKEQVIDLLQRVCTVSVETMKIIGEMEELEAAQRQAGVG